MKIAHLGHSTIYLELADGIKIIIDPYIDANLPEMWQADHLKVDYTWKLVPKSDRPGN